MALPTLNLVKELSKPSCDLCHGVVLQIGREIFYCKECDKIVPLWKTGQKKPGREIIN